MGVIKRHLLTSVMLLLIGCDFKSTINGIEFESYDLNNDGKVTKEEAQTLYNAIYEGQKKLGSEPVFTKERQDKYLEIMFGADSDNDGYLTKREAWWYGIKPADNSGMTAEPLMPVVFKKEAQK